MDQESAPLDERARRFLFRRRLGEGAFGVVWEAYDTERGARVALKALTRTEPSSLYLFKREFRALADIVHPNLVTLFELLSLGDRWFFTMEFIDGVDFIEHVRGPAPEPQHSRTAQTMTLLRTRAPEGRMDASYEIVPQLTNPGPEGGDLWYDQPTIESGKRLAEQHAPMLSVSPSDQQWAMRSEPAASTAIPPVRITWPPPSQAFQPDLLRAALV